MKAKTKWTVGDVLFEVQENGDKGTVEMNLWEVTSIRNGEVLAALKAPWTFGKVFGKDGKPGWKSKIPDWCRLRWKQGEAEHDALATTKRGAWLKTARKCEGNYETYKNDPSFVEECKRWKTIAQTSRRMMGRATK